MTFEHQEIGTSFRINGDVDPLIFKRMDEAYKRTREAMNYNMFAGVTDKPKPLTLRQKLRRYIDRVESAWLVLTGRADIE